MIKYSYNLKCFTTSWLLFAGMTALKLASVSGHMGTIRTLIDAGANYDPIPSITTCQITPLMIAAQHGNDAVVRLYLDKGVSANKSVPKIGMYIHTLY